MTDLRKAAEMALDALVKQHEWMVANDGMFQIPSRKAINALRQALASGVKQEFKLYDDGVPPKREWVGLTDEDRREFAAAQYGWEDLLAAADAKLKEKNGYTTCPPCNHNCNEGRDCPARKK